MQYQYIVSQSPNYKIDTTKTQYTFTVVFEQESEFQVSTLRREIEMAWSAVRSFLVPTVDMSVVRSRAPLAAGAGFVSVAGTTLWRSSSSSSKRSVPFACLGISTDSRERSYFLSLFCNMKYCRLIIKFKTVVRNSLFIYYYYYFFLIEVQDFSVVYS